MSKVWLVTGSGSGLGRNIAQAVLASGDSLVATARDPRQLEDLVQKYGDHVRAVPLDVADEGAAHAAVQVAVDAFGRLDVVVNNAGYGDVAPFEQLSSERFKAVMDTNFYGVVYVTRAALPIMRKQKSGCILQISSVGGRLALPGSAAYHAAKWAVGGFTESLAQEVAPFGVKVCAFGAKRIAIRSRWLNSSCVWPTANISRLIFWSVAMPSNTPARPRPPGRRKRSAGGTSASRPMWKRRGRCLIYDSEENRG